MPPGVAPKPLDELKESSRKEIARRRSKQGFEARQLKQQRSNASSISNQITKVRKSAEWKAADSATRKQLEDKATLNWKIVL